MECKSCNGLGILVGQVSCCYCNDSGVLTDGMPCDECNGEMGEDEYACEACEGTGTDNIERMARPATAFDAAALTRFAALVRAQALEDAAREAHKLLDVTRSPLVLAVPAAIRALERKE